MSGDGQGIQDEEVSEMRYRGAPMAAWQHWVVFACLCGVTLYLAAGLIWLWFHWFW